MEGGVLPGGVLQVSQGAVPVLAGCPEHSTVTRQDPSPGKGTAGLSGEADRANTNVWKRSGRPTARGQQ